MLENEGILCEFLNPQKHAEGVLSDFRNGQVLKNHPVFSSHEHSIQIVAYSDDFEVVNPLDPHKKHKMTAFYYILGNPRSRAKKPIILTPSFMQV